MIDINSLRRLAQAATPGPWEFWHGMIATDIDNDGGVVIANRPTPSGGKLQARVDTNFQYIVAANPAAITELLDRLEAAEKERDELLAKSADAELLEALAEQEKLVPKVSHGLCGGCAKTAADGWALYCVECWEKAEPVKQEPVAYLNLQPVINWLENGCDPKEAAKELRIYQEQMKAAPVDAKAIRAEALEEAAKWCEAKQSYNAMHANTEFAAAIRGLK